MRIARLNMFTFIKFGAKFESKSIVKQLTTRIRNNPGSAVVYEMECSTNSQKIIWLDDISKCHFSSIKGSVEHSHAILQHLLYIHVYTFVNFKPLQSWIHTIIISINFQLFILKLIFQTWTWWNNNYSGWNGYQTKHTKREISTCVRMSKF